MGRKLSRGEVVLAQDPYKGEGKRRPVLIISDESYPFYPRGYLGVPFTTKDKPNTFEVTDYDKAEVWEEFHYDTTYVNPYSPHQVNEYGRSLMRLDESFLNIISDRICAAVGHKITA